MDSEEREIFHFLKTWGSEYVSVREIGRRTGGKQRFHKNPDWARPVLMHMAERGILESDAQGRFRVKPVRKAHKGNRWVSPEIAKIFQEKGLKVEGAGETGSDDYYEQL